MGGRGKSSGKNIIDRLGPKAFIASCNVVFGISPKNAPFQTQIINLVLEIKAISEGKIILDRMGTKEYFDSRRSIRFRR